MGSGSSKKVQPDGAAKGTALQMSSDMMAHTIAEQAEAMRELANTNARLSNQLDKLLGNGGGGSGGGGATTVLPPLSGTVGLPRKSTVAMQQKDPVKDAVGASALKQISRDGEDLEENEKSKTSGVPTDKHVETASIEGDEIATPFPDHLEGEDKTDKASAANIEEMSKEGDPEPSKIKKRATIHGVVLAPIDLNFPVADDYDFTKTTTENYGAPKSKRFYGSYIAIRKLADYSYHSNYKKERQLWQDNVVDSVVSKTVPQATPWIVYTCGPMGAGKGFAMQWMSDSGFFPLENIVHVDPDHFKSVMSEWKGYTDRDTGTAGSMCHQESGYIQELAQEVAMAKSQNIWIDGSLRNGDWFSNVYDDIRDRFPKYRIAIFYVYATEATIRARVKSREEKTGRGVPEKELVDSLLAPDKSLGKLVSKVDFIARIDNNYEVPRLASFEHVDNSGSWNLLKSRFARTQADPSEFPESLAPLWLSPFTLDHNNFVWTDDLLKGITTPGGETSTLVALNQATFKADSSMAKVQALIENPQVRLSPAYAVNLDAESRGEAGVPLDAQSFVYCYGVEMVPNVPHTAKERWQKVADMTLKLQMSLLTKAGNSRIGLDTTDPLVALVIHGGYLYFDHLKKVCGATAIVDRGESDALLQFNEGVQLSEDESDAAVLKYSPRFAEVTLPFMTTKGAWRYAWVLPGEVVTSQSKNKYGGFLYQFAPETDMKCRFFSILSAQGD